mgnify:CR=1 FL=1
MKTITPLAAFLEDFVWPGASIFDRDPDSTFMVGLGLSNTGNLIYRLIDDSERVAVPLTLSVSDLEEIAKQMLLKAALLGPPRPLDSIQAWFASQDLAPTGCLNIFDPITGVDIQVVVPDPEFLGYHCIDAGRRHGLGIRETRFVCRLGPPIRTRYQRLKEA